MVDTDQNILKKVFWISFQAVAKPQGFVSDAYLIIRIDPDQYILVSIKCRPPTILLSSIAAALIQNILNSLEREGQVLDQANADNGYICLFSLLFPNFFAKPYALNPKP